MNRFGQLLHHIGVLQAGEHRQAGYDDKAIVDYRVHLGGFGIRLHLRDLFLGIAAAVVVAHDDVVRVALDDVLPGYKNEITFHIVEDDLAAREL